MRTFTSMMMQCLSQGGMKAVFDREWDDRHNNFIRSNYHPNPHGFFEISDDNRRKLNTNPKQFGGCLIKLLNNYGHLGLPHWEGQYQIILMMRDPIEILDSYRKFFNKDIEWEDKDDYSVKIKFTPGLYQELMSRAIKQFEDRRDIRSVSIIPSKQVFQNPLSVFYYLKEKDWPIEPWWAMQAIDQKLYRSVN